VLHRIVQSYLAAGQTADQLIRDARLGPRDERRVRFGAGNLIEAVSPSNLPLVNPPRPRPSSTPAASAWRAAA